MTKHQLPSLNIAETFEDFVWAKADWAPCINEKLHGLDIWATSQPTFGITLLNAFKKTKDVRSAGSQYLAFIEANNEATMSLGDISGTSFTWIMYTELLGMTFTIGISLGCHMSGTEVI